MAKERIAPDSVFKARGYSHAYKVGSTVYLAGQAPFDQEMNLVGKGDIVAQMEQTFQNMKRVLEAAGATMEDIVKLTTYIKNIDDMYKTGDVFRKWFQGRYPPATAVGVSGFMGGPDQLLEVDAIAVVE